MSYIQTLGQEAPECVFCGLTAVPDGPDNLVVHRGDKCYIVLNLYPYNNGHAMIVPYRHVARLAELEDDERAELMQLASVLEVALAECSNAQGFNLGMNLGRTGGAGIPEHLHLHVVPRWPGDTNFMPVVGQTKVLPERLSDTWEKLRAAVGRVLSGRGTGE
ncbi:MAG: HIT domain-containing protein [Synechococcaceae cyanobacterium]|nr:HIT domain-containing protein [Synechococcaceae cyanobacterium]